jgi:hypothetical protein
LFLNAGKGAGQPAALVYGADCGIGHRREAQPRLDEAFESDPFRFSERIEGGVEVLFAPTVSALDADIDARPVLNRRRNGGAL